MNVTDHAAQRYVERVNPALTVGQARAAILESTRAVKIAASIGCRTIRLGSGVKLILDGQTVITCIPADQRLSGHRRKPSQGASGTGPVGHPPSDTPAHNNSEGAQS